MKKSLRGSLGQKDQRSEICSQTYMYCKMQKQTCRQLHVFKLKMNLSHNLKNGLRHLKGMFYKISDQYLH